MDYAKTASLVIKYVGGKSNIKSVAHCATRLRFQLKDNELRDEEAISGKDKPRIAAYHPAVSYSHSKGKP